MVRVLPLVIAINLFLLPSTSFGQQTSYVLHIKKAQSTIQIDGKLDEADWGIAETAGDFHRVTPIDTGYSDALTEVMMTYDDENLYLAAICYDDLPGKHIIESLRRDFSFGRNDNFLVFLDPFNDRTTGFSFGASAAGAQWDGLLADGGSRGADLEWDNKWESVVVQYEDRWVFEMAVPFKSIRYKEGVDQWGVNFSRLDLKRNEKSSWSPVPRQFATSTLAFTGKLQWDQAPPPPGTNISLIPYFSAGVSKDHQVNGDYDFTSDIGGDVKVAISSSLNLDLTVNPDFSQVEVDRQVTNLDRFELFFPEQRQFFLENSDLFANFGFDRLRPFFSRRIGLESPIIAGARLSGKINQDWRLGVMNIATNKQDSANLPAQNYSVLAIQRRVLSRSNISAIFVNRDAFNFDEYQSEGTPRNKYNRVAGVDFNLASNSNIWTGKIMYHHSFSPQDDGSSFAHGVNLRYRTQYLLAEWNHEIVGEGYSAEVGFVPRKGYFRWQPVLEYKIYPKTEKLINHGPNFEANMFWNPDFNLTDREIVASYEVQWSNTATLMIGGSDNYIKLLAPFDPTNSGGDSLATGTDYNWQTVAMGFQSDRRKIFSYTLEASTGGYYHGNRTNFNGSVIYRYQPYGSISLNVTYDRIDLPDPFNDAKFWLISPKIDFTFTDKIFLTTFIQYNEQIDNVNLNARFQWRFKPVSDLFLIYSDNYFTQNLRVKNRAIILKISYWLNL